MSLSNTSILFLSELTRALRDTVCDGHWTPRGRTYLIGNGGSAAVASHIANDMVKGMRDAFALTDPSILTCLANDYGYEHVYEEQIKAHCRTGDTLVAISSSGKSQNILKACKRATLQDVTVITLSGFDIDNPLRSLGNVNYWVPSSNYGIVEIAHLAILHSII